MKEHFLVVDDMSSMRALIRKYLRDLGFENVTLATNGMEAMRVLNARSVDVVVTDWNMPVMDGMSLLKSIRKKTQWNSLPVLMITAEVARDQVKEAIRNGVTDFLVKPFTEDYFERKITSVLERKRSGKLNVNSPVLDMEEDALNREVSEHDIQQLLKVREDAERIMLHDMKNPILSIQQSLSELVAASGDNPDTALIIQRITRAVDNLQGMTRLSADLQKIEQKTYQLPLQQMDIADICLQILKEKQNQCHELRLRTLLNGTPIEELQHVPAIRVRGDQVLCYSMLANLIKNAIEASPMRGRISVDCQIEGTEVQITISNKGVVPSSIRETFFQKYSTAGKTNGSGLGTYSAFLIAQAHGGSLSMAVDDSIQTTFLKMTLPMWQD